MPRFDFQCPKGHVSESVQDREMKLARCKVCDRIASRIITAVPPVRFLGQGFTRRAA